MTKQIASVSLDLDNKWSYLKTHGDASWQSLPSYLELVVPRYLDILQSMKSEITVFVVGLDAEQPQNGPILRRFDEAGHEIGNHSYHHEPWLHEYTTAELEIEISRAEDAIFTVTGQRPRGFRGPGFSFSQQLLDVLTARDYDYDASTFPTFLGPAARFYYFCRSRLTRKQRAQRRQLFGSWHDGFQPLRPFCWETQNGPLIEIPVSTMPWLRVPIHLSYIVYLARWSRLAAISYLQTALQLCRWHRISPSFLLHPLDLLGCDDDGDLSFFPGMDLTYDYKRKIFEQSLRLIAKYFKIVTMREHAEHTNQRQLPRRRCQREGNAGVIELPAKTEAVELLASQAVAEKIN